MAKTYDAVVVGAGHNGMICAAYLAKAGRSVLVLERRHLVGGATVTEELYPGFKYTVCSYVISLLRPHIINDLQLPRFGFELLPLDGTFTPSRGDVPHLMRWHDGARTRLELMRHSARDAEAYERFGKTMFHMAMAVRDMLVTSPPDPTSLKPSNLARLAGVGKSFTRHGAEHVWELAKLMTMSSGDYVEQFFETPALQATLSASGMIGTYLGPRSPGSAYVMLHHYMGEIDGQFRAWGLPRGGMGGFAENLRAAAESLGVEFRTEAPVERILVKRGKAVGVVLAGSGEEIRAGVVASSLDPRLTFGKLVDEKHLDEDFRQRISRFRFRGSSGKVNLSLDALPEFTCLEGKSREEKIAHLAGAISLSPSIDYLERAFDDAKYGRFSRHPYMDMVIPSLIDPTMAPPGKHVMSMFVQYAPYELAEGPWDDAKRDAFGDTVINTLAEYAPNIKDLILHRQVLTPADMEATFGLTEGNIFHGELSLEQLFFLRPTPGYVGYESPVRGLYLCGSGAHPGGGVMGAPAHLAAQEILGKS